MRASGRAGTAAHAVVCCDYLVCGSALLLTIIAFCKNCINHVVTIHKALVGISIQRRDSQCERTGVGVAGPGRTGNKKQWVIWNLHIYGVRGENKKMSRLDRKKERGKQAERKGISADVVFVLAVAHKQITAIPSSYLCIEAVVITECGTQSKDTIILAQGCQRLECWTTES